MLAENDSKRIDPEYFIKEAISAFRRLKTEPRLSSFVKEGYRVIYENTKIVEREEGIANGLPLFLQSADIDTPFINEEGIACAPAEDWERYPKGKIKIGELLIEVKGKAEKIAVVPQGFPKKTLVTGTCYKMSTHKPWQRSLLIAHLTGRYGSILKGRLKTNLLVAFISRDDLYRIPVPQLSETLNAKIHIFVEGALATRNEILGQQRRAESVLMAALGTGDWSPPEPLKYTASASSARAAARLDAQYFMPSKEQVRKSLGALPGRLLSARVDSIRDQWLPEGTRPGTVVRNYDVTDALVPILNSKKEPSAAEDIGSMKKVLRDGDVAMSRLRAYLKEIAVVRTSDNILSVGSSEFIVLRPKGGGCISPETLVVFLRSEPVQTILKWCQDGSQHPRFSESDLLSIPVPDAVLQVSAKITALMLKSFAARRRAVALLDAAKRAVEIAIEQDEAAALRFLDTAEA